MIAVDVTKQTPYEYKEYFRDALKFLVRKTFNHNDELLFVTYQPRELTLSAQKVIEHTKKLFGALPYVEVIEQTYKTTKRYNDGNYIDGYHSHILIRKSDYETVEHLLKHLDIVPKKTFNLEGLTDRYLVKQAGLTHQRILPTQNIPIAKPQLIEETKTISVAKDTILNFKPVINFVIKTLHQLQISRAIRINKIKVALMFIDDT